MAASDRFAALDDPVTGRQFLDGTQGAFTHAVFSVPALHCASCLWLLEQLWKFHPGIGRSEVDLLRRTVRVSFMPDRIGLRGVAECLASLGYEPVLDAERASDRLPPARRRLYLQIGLAGFAFGNMMLFSVPRYANGAPLEPAFQTLFDSLNLLLAVPVLLYSASDFYVAAWRSLRLRAITLDVPIALGLTALFTRSVADILTRSGEGYLDSFAGLVFFLLIGRLFQQTTIDRIAFDRTVRSFLPLSVRVTRRADSALVTLDDLAPGDEMLVRPQEVVPADARLLDARGCIDYAFITGETTPAMVTRGEPVAAGGRVVGEALRLEVVRGAAHSGLAALWSHPVFTTRPPHWMTTVANRFGHWFTITAIALAAAGFAAWWPDARMAAQVATAVLIIACPCALTLAAPITLGTALGRLGQMGCYLKQGAVVLDLSRLDTIAFDKTGTLAAAQALVVTERGGLTPDDWRRVERLAAESTHPVSRALAGRAPLHGTVRDVFDTPGLGITGQVDGRMVGIGSAALASRLSAHPVDVVAGRTWVVVDGRVGWVRLAAQERPGMVDVASRLSAAYHTWLLSGDDAEAAPHWHQAFGGRMRFRQSPDDKLAAVREQQGSGRRVLMVGDGLNDAGALAAADVGMAVSDDTACLVPACDVVIAGHQLPALPSILRYARRARYVIVLCFAVSVLYNVVGIGLALAGLLTPLATAILMPVSSVTIVGLSVGLMRVRPPKGVPA